MEEQRGGSSGCVDADRPRHESENRYESSQRDASACGIRSGCGIRPGCGIRLACDAPSEAAYILDEVAVRECYLPSGSGIALNGGTRGCIIDGGANIGIFTLWACAGRDPSWVGSELGGI